MESDISTLAGRVAARMAELGLSQADIARRGRFNATFVSDLLRGKKLTLHAGNYGRLARALLTTQAYLQTGTQPSEAEIDRIKTEVGWQPEYAPAEPELSPDAAADLDAIARHLADQAASRAEIKKAEELGRFPVYRSGGRFDGGSIVESFPLYHLTLPIKVQSNGLYAVAISDTTMSPRYEPGELAYAHKSAIARPKDYVSILVKGRMNYRDTIIAYIRQLVHESADEVIVRQISPSIETRYARDSIEGIHRVVFAGEPIEGIGL
ncbi:hypothetical protein NIM87_07645 [Devosia sp. XJ19-1]|uniref:HTH cro/C1-type domain-containing protein n=1 Tax=Devosia ureilytica TaxID=2952754 RepID=A0A9Q4AM73_9HYPH|nr:hypothetical protein [Devosia ureilytica]MCP8883367.1 hypothetical protein [Devosia ureilytica]MCP8886265.1 hypothetical protein [Devosia ureilytica]